MRILLVLLLTVTVYAGPDDDILALMQEDFEAGTRAWPTSATSRGDRRFDALMPDPSPAAAKASQTRTRALLARARLVPRDKLSPRVRVHRDLFVHELEWRLLEAKFHPEHMPVTQMNGPQQWIPQLPARTTFSTEKHFVDYVSRLEKIAAYLDGVTANMRAGLAAGRTPPRVTLAAAADQALTHGAAEHAKHPRRHALWPPFPEAMKDGPLAKRAAIVIGKSVVPAFARFGTFLRDEYIPNCRDTIAASDSVDGRAYYDAQLRHHTTLPLTADEIHTTGLAEVKRIRAEMMGVIAKTDFKKKDDFAAFIHYLRTDPRFYFTDKKDLLAGYRDIAKRIDAWMPKLFKTLPRLPYGVREMPAYIAPAAPTAYYYSGSLEAGKPGYFVANTYRLDQRPRYEMIPLTLHEAVPGHHHQGALAREIDGMPKWRTTQWYTAFGEGWALYAERLGLEMGDLLADPYDDFGRLSYEMWRALRLVVDTGLHAKGWTRDRAIEYMLANSALTRTNVTREVDRYIAWPGQATAYKIGELKIRALRAEAEKALGKKFDLREFHDCVLLEGSIPLPVLERRVREWIAAQK